MKTRTRKIIEYERQYVTRAPSPASCSVLSPLPPHARGRAMIDIYPPAPKKRVRARKFVRPPTIWDYSRGHRSTPFALRSLALLLIIALNAYAFSSVGVTTAYYLDGESLRGNSYVAGSVDFVLSSTPYSPLASALGLAPGMTATRTVSVIPEAGTNAFWYHASSTNFGADLDLCENLSLQSSLEGVQNYSGLLKNFISPATTTLSNWQFDVSMDSALYNKVCTFDLEYTAWQERHNVPGFTEMGYHDTEKESNKIASRGLRLNKVYYDVLDGSTPSPCVESFSSSVGTNTTTPCTSSTSSTATPSRGSEAWNEWVEVYNQTNVEQNITGWSICDNMACDVIPRTAIIPPFGFALITASSTTLSLWNIPTSFPFAVLADGTIGDGLDNDNDMLILKRPDGVTMDQMNYGENPNIGWTNYNADVWVPGTIDVPEGKVLARNPTGYDTDQPSDWAGFGVPAITLLNPSSSSGGTWNWGVPHNIQWTATNPNGPNTDLLIDIYYIKDTDSSRTITPADVITPIVVGTNNDGSYQTSAMSVSSGYFWIEVVATGIENVLLNDVDYSGKLFGSSSSVCKTSDSKSSISGCSSSKDSDYRKDDTNNKNNDDEKDHERGDDKKHDDDDEAHDTIVKDSSKHDDKDSNKDSHNGLAEHSDDGKNMKKESDEHKDEVVVSTPEKPEEAISSVTVFKKEEELVVIAKENTSQNDNPEQNSISDPVSVFAMETRVAVPPVTITE